VLGAPEIAELAALEVAKTTRGRRNLSSPQQATRLFASTEAAVLAQRALGALSALPEDDDRKRRELKTLLTLIPALVATTGYASQKVGEAGERAVALCETLGDPALLVPALISVWQVQISKGILPKADELAERLRSAADRTGDQFHMHRGPVALGIGGVPGSSRGRLRAPSARAALVPSGIARARTLEFGQDAVSSSGMRLRSRSHSCCASTTPSAPSATRRLGARPESSVQPRLRTADGRAPPPVAARR
jgi:hypothetical protein